jgi:hypothetical protein
MTHPDTDYIPALRRLSTQMETLLSHAYDPRSFAAIARNMHDVLAAYLRALDEGRLGTAPGSISATSPSTGGAPGTGGPSCP